MSLMKPGLLSILILSAAILSGFAQGGTSKIEGYIYNPDNTPSAFSTVVLMNKDSVFMDGTISETDGSFLIEDLAAGNYLIMVRNIEFKTFVSNLIALEEDGQFVLDRIQLEPSVNTLDEIVIRGERAILEIHPDKMVYNVGNSVNASGNNGLELLSKSPGVLVDMDNNILLQGKSGVQIFINGRPSRISGSDLTNMLEGMRSENIESIEIISNPSSRFDAEGSGGIINIVLKKNTKIGFNGNIISSYSSGLRARSSVGTSLNYSGEKINVFTSFNLSDNDFLEIRNESMLRRDFLLDMDSRTTINRRGINFSGALDYQVGAEQSLSVDVRIFSNDRHEILGSDTYIFDVKEVIDPELLVAEAIDNAQSANYNGNVHYSFNPNKSSSLTADVSFGKFSSDRKTLQPNLYYNETGSELLRSVNSEFNSNTDIGLMSAQIDYENKLENYSISTGAKFSYIQTDNQLAFYDLLKEDLILNVNRSNDFAYLEKVAAAYAIVTAKPTKTLSLNAGLRIENTSSLGELESAIVTADDVVARNYTSLFPNVSVAFDNQGDHTFSLGIGRRITRPNYQDLNPFERKLSELAAWRGNPFLQPNYITNYQMSYSFKRKLVLSNTYSVTSNFFANIFEVVGDKGNVIIPRNMDKVTSNGLSISYPQKVFDWWEFSTFLLYNYTTYNGDIEGTNISLDANIINFRWQNKLQLPLDVTMELSCFASSPWIWRGTVYVDGNYRINIGFRKEFFNKRFLLQLNANDLFNSGSVYYYDSDYGGMIINGDINFDGRRVALSATYKLGNSKAKSRRGRSAMDDELKRISE
ncbi:MAG: TonB-dependent receptor [Saprospiraceae bacterium]|nr:TonB-dependent receptor [Saprospiraceae bacterium]